MNEQAANPGARLAASFHVRFDEARPDGTIRPSVLLRYAAELAWLHSEQLGFGRDWYRERGLSWVVRGVDLQLVHPIADGATIVGVTEPVAARQVMARRRTEFFDAAGRLVAAADVDWALVSADGPQRIPAIFYSVFTMAEWTVPAIRVRDAPPAEPAGLAETAGLAGIEITVRPQELDPLGHVNNAVYLDWVEEALAAVEPGFEPRRFLLEFRVPAAAGQHIRVSLWPSAGGARSARITVADSNQVLVGVRLVP